MKLHRINALLIRHLYLYQRSFPRIMDIIYWPVMELLVWGFLSVYIEKMNLGGFNVVTVLLGAVIFWDFLNQSQKSVSIAFLEEVWEKNIAKLRVRYPEGYRHEHAETRDHEAERSALK